MKECFLITSYCDTESKIKVVNNCIDNLRQFGIDICVYAHYPLSLNIQEKVDYYIYDFSNPVLFDYYLSFWRIYNNLKLTIDIYDYSYAVLQQIKRGFDFLKRLNYNKIIIINYDILIDESLTNKIFKSLDNFDVKLFYWKNNICNSTLIGMKCDLDLDFVQIDNYLACKKDNGQYDAETYIDFNFNKYFNCDKTFSNDWLNNYTELINYDSESSDESGQPWMLYNFSDYKLHIGQYNGKVAILFFGVKIYLIIKIDINNKIYEYATNSDDFFILDIDWKDINNIQVWINDTKVKDDILKSFLKRNAQIIDM